MKEMPTATLPADSEYVYVPDSDSWIVQKKSGNKILSKKDIKADLPKPPLPEDRGSKAFTKFDPEYEFFVKLVQLVIKAGVPVQEIQALGNTNSFTTIDDVGDMAAKVWTLATTKYHIPREWLIRKLPEKKSNLKQANSDYCEECGSPLRPDDEEFCRTCLHNKRRFSDVMDQIREIQRIEHRFVNWREKEKLEQEWDKLHPQANLKHAYEGGYPTEEDSVQFGIAPQGNTAYEPYKENSQTGLREGDTGEPILICPTCKSDKIDTESNPAKCLDCGVDFIPKPDRSSDDQTVNDYSQNYFWGPNDLGRSHQNQPGANGWLPAGTEDMDGPSSNVRMSSFNSFMHKQSSLNKVSHCGPCSVLKLEVLHILIDLYYKDNNLFPEEIIEELSLAATELKIDNFNDILESVITEYLEEASEEVGDKLPKLKNLLIALKDIAPKLGKEIEVVDKQENVEKEAKKDYWTKAKCPICGEFKSTDLTPKEREDRGWECVDCQEKKFNKKQAAKEEYPKIAKDKSGYVDNGIGYTCGRCEYFNPERERCKKVEGTIKSFGCCNFWDGEGKFKEKNKTAEQKALETDKRALTKEEAVYVQYPNVDYRCDECVFFDSKAQTCTKVEGSISPTASCNFWQPINKKKGSLDKQASLDEVLDQTTQDAIAAEYGVQYLIPLRFYKEALGYGQTPERAFQYALEEGKREKQEIDPKQLAELVETYF